MNTNNDDATKALPAVNGAGGESSRESRGASRTAAAADGITSRISALKQGGSAQDKGSSRSSSRAGSSGAVPVGARPASAQGSQHVSGAASFRESVNRKAAAVKSGAADAIAQQRAAAAANESASRGTGRRVRLTLARIDPWSVMKFSFLVAVAFGLATVIATALLWQIVDAIGLWDQLKQMSQDLSGGKDLSIMSFFTFSKMISYATIVSVVNVVIMTALGTLFAFLYNIVAALLGGLKMTFTDD